MDRHDSTYPHTAALEERFTTLVFHAGNVGRPAGADVMEFISADPEVRDWLRGLGWTPPGEDAATEAADLIRSLIPPRRRPSDVGEVVDVHGCTWAQDSFGGWTSLTCEESPLASRADIDLVAGPLVAVERG